MNRQELLKILAQKTGSSRQSTDKFLTAFLEIVKNQLIKGDDLTLMDFGTFSRGTRKARRGYNPHTREEIQIPELYLAKFVAGKEFKEALNQKSPKKKE